MTDIKPATSFTATGGIINASLIEFLQWQHILSNSDRNGNTVIFVIVADKPLASWPS